MEATRRRYHATPACLFANGLFGDATPHLKHAAELLPADALILFDRGCHAEILGLPMHQALLSERDLAEYHLCAGRDTDNLLKALWAGMPH